MKVLVTGANGFIGQSLCPVLKQKGYDVRGALRPQTDSNIPREIHDIFSIGEIGAETDWRQALIDVDVVVHLAARVHVIRNHARNTLDDFRKVNVEGTKRLATMAAHARIKRFIYMSTIKVMGEQTVTAPLTEADPPLPQDPYAISKLEAEQHLFRISEETGMEIVVLRPSLVYGPGVKANFLSLLKLISSGICIPLASVKNLRSFTYSLNLVDAIETCLIHPNAAGEIFLVSDDQNISTPELIRLIAQAMNRPPRLLPFPLSGLRFFGYLSFRRPEVERLIMNLCADIRKIKSTLAWKPPFSMSEGISETVNWYQERFFDRPV